MKTSKVGATGKSRWKGGFYAQGRCATRLRYAPTRRGRLSHNPRKSLNARRFLGQKQRIAVRSCFPDTSQNSRSNPGAWRQPCVQSARGQRCSRVAGWAILARFGQSQSSVEKGVDWHSPVDRRGLCSPGHGLDRGIGCCDKSRRQPSVNSWAVPPSNGPRRHDSGKRRDYAMLQKVHGPDPLADDRRYSPPVVLSDRHIETTNARLSC